MRSTITEQQAFDKAEEYVRQAVTALPDEVTLELEAPPDSLSCDDPSDQGPRGRVTVATGYWVRGIENENKYFDAILVWAKDHDFFVMEDLRPKENRIRVENRNDGFRLAFEHTLKGDLLIGVDSPCVWPDGTPAPE